MVVVELPVVRGADPGPAGSRRVRAPWRVLFTSLSTLYFAVGYLLTVRYNLFDPDAVSRVANAGYVLESRDPHLSAVGFIWNPLPSLVEVPILQFSHWWPELRTHGVAGVLQSAPFMAAAAVMVDRIARERGVGPGWRRLAVAAFALHPMIIVYGGSGMSEAAQTFAILWCVRHLLRWTESRAPRDLAWAGLALAVGYLTRYEVAVAALGVGVFVAVTTAYWAPSSRMIRALANVAVVMFPIAMAAAVWALSGWVVNQELFATLSSRYGNESIVASAIERGWQPAGSGDQDWVSVAARTFGMQPFAGIACGVAIVHAALTRTTAALVPIACIGPILVFAAWGQITATTFGCFRYYLLGVPLVICVALASWRPGSGWRRLGMAMVGLSVLIGFPVTAAASLDYRIGNQPLQFGLTSLLFPQRLGEDPEQVWYRRSMVEDRLLAAHLDRLRLGDGAVLMDTFNTWGVWMSSSRPKQFIISSDYDFKAAVNRPWEHGVQYLLVSSPAISDADALNVRYPTLWADGAGIGDLVYVVYGTGGEERFRLYRMTGPPQALLDADEADPPPSAGSP